MRNVSLATDDPGRLRVSGKFFRRGEGGPECFVKAVTFGPFPHGLFPGDEAREQFEFIKSHLGANAVRFYEPPSQHWLNDLTDLGLMAFLTIPWNQHVDFLSNSRIRREAEIRVRDLVQRYRGHPAVAACFVGNEIESSLVRYLGPREVVRFIEHLIEVARAQDPGVLYAYANYPSTEYLVPENQDFLAFNVYLEERNPYRDYLFRLQSLAGSQPVMVSEFGSDSRSHSLEGQAEMHAWQIEEACRAGLAGTTLFSWSDHWARGGETIVDWDFGLTNREGQAKPALRTTAAKWAQVSRAIEGVPLERKPHFSVIVCTYKGAARIGALLDSLLDLDYPAYEIIVINDGNDDEVRSLVQPIERVRLLGMPHGGLSKARNMGAKIASGEILVYTDDDCVVPPDWLTWLAVAFAASERPDCVGGPNLPPPAKNIEQARIIAAPGGPAHVLTGDRAAEHIPGCNLAVKKKVFEMVGGFNEIFQSAGDDVDFCWRLLDRGHSIGFHPAAFVWHFRRENYRAYFRQQKGYGRAEALLKPLHRKRFSGFGGAVWQGAVYEGSALALVRSSGKLRHGLFGREPFQSVYVDRRDPCSALCHVIHVTLLSLLLVLAPFFPWLLVPAAWGGIMTAGHLVKAARRARLPTEFDTFASRAAVARLTFAQGFLRSAVRMGGAWRDFRPFSFCAGLLGAMIAFPRLPFSNSLAQRFWSENGVTRADLHRELTKSSVKPDPSGECDFIFWHGLFFRTSLITTTEYHEKQNRLTRTRMKFQLNTVIFLCCLGLVLGVGIFLGNPWWLPLGLAGMIVLEWWGKAYVGCGKIYKAARKCGLVLVD